MRNETHEDRCRRKANQCWELSGLARCDGDTVDEERWCKKAMVYDRGEIPEEDK